MEHNKSSRKEAQAAGGVVAMERLTMTIPEFAEATGISKNLAYDLARRDQLPVPVIKLGRRMVLSQKAVTALLEANGDNPGGKGERHGE